MGYYNAQGQWVDDANDELASASPFASITNTNLDPTAPPTPAATPNTAQAAQPATSPFAHVGGLGGLAGIGQQMGQGVKSLVNPAVNQAPTSLTTPVTAPTTPTDVNMGSYMGKPVTSMADPDFLKRLAGISALRQQTVDGQTQRAQEAEQEAIRRTALAGSFANAGGELLHDNPTATPYVDAVNRAQDKMDSAAQLNLTGASSDNDKIGQYARQAFDDNVKQEGTQYDRAYQTSRDSVKDGEWNKQFDFNKSVSDRDYAHTLSRDAVGDKQWSQDFGLKSEAEKDAHADRQAAIAAKAAAKQGDAVDAASIASRLARLSELSKQINAGVGPGTGGLSRIPGFNKVWSALPGTDGALRDEFNTLQSGLALDLAKAKMKGQGSISNGERQILADSLPSLDKDDSANQAAIQRLAAEGGYDLSKGGSPVQKTGPQEGATVVDPATGQTHTFRNGRWN